MDMRDFFLSLLLVKNISYIGRTKIWRFLLANPDQKLPLKPACLKGILGNQFVGSYPTLQDIANLRRLPQISILDADYPTALKESINPPLVLFYRGNRHLLQQKKLAIVGTRQASDYAFRCLVDWVPALVEADYTIVSGLASGVDGLAHEITLAQAGNTIAVIGTGLNVTYPKRVNPLQIQIGQRGLILTEYLPDSQPLKHHFPARNRIIAALAMATIIVEAKTRSGSLITAQYALEENRYVFALPGPIDKVNSQGTNHLIDEGAIPILSKEDLLKKLADIVHYI
ncbi:DNA processing protein DprA [Weissella oryzae SG25]|uniref:DNA processing protein DprA n=1 Tax=Weissella oryzae (strain DSM 25784 / JCM 18191 / LMG 30913 / SG25) TaxID=1329250 RepID=A0A069CRG8_WEIOS|nr:DNA-processing protein DprA [Weissella oryzae]GAK30330.1 DNA processing protein DprA [Weissella oryzae SG25]